LRQKICRRLVGISVERKNKSVPSFCVFRLVSSISPQKIQDKGLKTKVKNKIGKNIKLGKTQAKKLLALLIFGLIHLIQPSTLPPTVSFISTFCVPRNHLLSPVLSAITIKKEIITAKCRNKITQVLHLLKTLFKK